MPPKGGIRLSIGDSGQANHCEWKACPNQQHQEKLMSPTKHHYTKYDIGSLCERMEARGQSRMLRSQPELCRDLLSGAALLRWMLDQAMPVAAIEVEVMLPDGL